jgi:hypothetical protein
VRAIYKKKEGGWVEKDIYNERLTTDWVTFEVTEKVMGDAIGKNWREVIQKAVERKMKNKERQKKFDDEYRKKAGSGLHN